MAIRPKINLYQDVYTHIERHCRLMCSLPVNFVIVTHDLPVHDEETGGHEHMPFTGSNNTALGAKLMAMVDVVGYTAVKDENQYVAQLVNGKGRKGGDRFKVLGLYREMDLTEWARLIAEKKTPDEAPAEKEAK